MTAFDKAWGVVKETGGPQKDCKRCKGTGVIQVPDPKSFFGNSKNIRCEQCPPYSTEKSDDLPMPVEKPFKMRRPGCDHNFVISNETMVGDTLYRTYKCTKCGEEMTSSPS